jgi:hypothetical protein
VANEISDDGARYLADALEINTVSQILHSSVTLSLSSSYIDAYNTESSMQQNQQ